MKLKGITALFTERMGGTSEFPYTSCNLGFHVGDDPERVVKNRERVADQIGIPLDAWVAGEQVHGAAVTVVTEEMRGRGARELSTWLPQTDALITNVRGIALTTYAADCVPILFADVEKQAIGVAHAGWKGTVAKIAAETVLAMAKTYGSQPDDIHVMIGPAIGACCYEVDAFVADKVRAAFAKRASELLQPNEAGRWQLDLWMANVLALEEVGVRPEQIHRDDRCTSCQVNALFSHRKEKGQTGRHAGIIALKQEK